MWTRYGNRHGASGVTHYRMGVAHIDIHFGGGDAYRYDAKKPGRTHLQEMKRLAEAGRGLSTYISQNVRENYALKLAPVDA